MADQQQTVSDPKAINGKEIADEIHNRIKEEVALLKEKGVVPGLAVVLVGERKDSQTYVRMKKLAAEKAGMRFVLKEIPESVTQDELLKVVQDLNADKEIHGFIVQMPLPKHIDEEKILDAIDHRKDVDGLHPLNADRIGDSMDVQRDLAYNKRYDADHYVGMLCQKGKDPLFVPCTPKGCIELIERKTSLEGKNVVVIGRSIGIPAAMLCLQRNATVTICHSRTKDLPSVVKQADIVIAAVGKAELVKKEWVKEGAIVIDVGINAVNDPSKKAGYRLVGDVDYNDVKQVASAITPVPGGVGPMTVAMLLSNTLAAAKRTLKQ